jgi:CRP-like cAMP-binding protein
MEVVRLSARQVLYEGFSPNSHCHFLGDTLASLVSTTEDGLVVAAGIVGDEGLLGFAAILDPRLLPHRTVVLVAGDAIRIPGEPLRLWCGRNSSLRRPILSYAHAMFRQLVQTSACNRFHDTKQRLARSAARADRLKAPALPFTQESLAELIGTDRVSVTRAAQALRRSRLIDYSRGKVTILNRKRLESVTCECYGIIRSAYDDLLNP